MSLRLPARPPKVMNKWELTLYFPSKGMRDAVQSLLKQLQKEEKLEKGGEALAFFLLKGWKELKDRRELRRLKKKLRELGEERDETASFKSSAKGSRFDYAGPGGAEVVQEFERGESSQGSREVEAVRSSVGPMCEMPAESPARSVEAGEGSV